MTGNLQKYIVVVSMIIMAILVTGCKKSDTKAAVLPGSNLTGSKPVANFSFTIANNRVFPCAVTFNDASQNTVSEKLDFGDGAILAFQTPIYNNAYTHTYTSPGVYNVKLVVTNNYGKDSITKQVTFASTAITGISAGYALPSSIITITGIGLNADIANNTVTINGVPAIINSATTTAITITVPANTKSGPLVLTTNGISITTNFTVYYPVVGISDNVYFKHITYSYHRYLSADDFGYDYNSEYDADWETDSVRYGDQTAQGANAQYVGFVGGYYFVPSQVKLWGLANGYAVASNDYRVYKYGGQSSYSVFAGSGVSGYADGQGTSAQFVAPQGMAADAAGNLYVNDAHRIRKISTTGLVSTFAGSGADGNANGQGLSATFGNLHGIVVDAAGNVYVSDNEYLNIRKITPSGMVTTFAGSGTAGFGDGISSAAQFYFPKGMAVDDLGDIFVSDSNYNTTGPYTSAIRMINPMGLVTTIFNSNKGDKISNPDGICYINLNGQLFICNTGPGASNQYVTTVNLVAK
jgi:PKD repeat protein